MSGLVFVSWHTDPLEAHILRCRLEAEGIPAFVAFENHIRMNWLICHALGGIRVQVPRALLHEALEVIEAIKAGTYDLADEQIQAHTCPKCGSNECTPNRNSWRIAFLAFFFLHIPAPFHKHALKCLSCGYGASENEF